MIEQLRYEDNARKVMTNFGFKRATRCFKSPVIERSGKQKAKQILIRLGDEQRQKKKKIELIVCEMTHDY